VAQGDGRIDAEAVLLTSLREVIAEITGREALLVNELGAADPSSAVLPYGEETVCPLLHESHPGG